MHFQLETDIVLLGFAIQLENKREMKIPPRTVQQTKSTVQQAGQTGQLAKLK